MSASTIGQDAATDRSRPMTSEEKKVILASSLGTIFEWYDFYLYGALAVIIGAQFFSAFDPNTRAIFALLAFAAGFLVRPFGAIFFGRLGDLIGRKHTFLITILIMGISTFMVGLLPNYESIGWVAPVILIVLRLLQGLALGGEYGGAAVYVAEHAPNGRRGFYTAWIQTTATLGLLLSLMVILSIRLYMGEEGFTKGTGYAIAGWRIPFLGSIFLLAISVWIRLQMQESPVFQKMKEEGAQSKAPLVEAFGVITAPLKGFLGLALAVAVGAAFMAQPLITVACIFAMIFSIAGNMFRIPNGRIVVLALLGLVVGQAVVWYTGQFYALFFLQNILKVDLLTANVLIAWSLILGTGFFLVFGALSDRIGRKPIILAGCLIAALTYFPLFTALTNTSNPNYAKALETVKIEVKADPAKCGSLFDPVGIRVFTEPCDLARRVLSQQAYRYVKTEAPVGSAMAVTVNGNAVAYTNPAEFTAAIGRAAVAAGYPAANDPAKVKVNGFFEALSNAQALKIIGILLIMVIYVTMVYGPIAAALVEFFPTRIRYTAMSLPYHIGNGWFGGLMPATSFAMVASSGDIYYGLWYPIGFALMTCVIGLLFVPETHKRDIFAENTVSK
jgi:MFS family permease